jgi:3-oxoacyl-[acyl-carrier protein] reductase
MVMTDLNRFTSSAQQEAAAAHTPLRRNAQPEDIAGAILLLVADQAGFVTGAYLPASGGLQLR